ncbi:ribosome-binding protein 1 isoform X1 [Glossina fuscipes]|uniref:Ribosome-binding protein 1 isoform X1 n=1 Tax=Glossina fuscipes TaxID=7396 RepID=A0A9C5ZCV3_9MUSC|nr:ribosome-binding protein 1 isoform X1 [Glossina fuscipes]XP_037891985.1 ribosome-binding protein 1 isoform X1 [Glossina fuscipes]XP_037891986.1 ribosome-binding protein 1 isoform X1 [Glossina fuscipes]XP_037891987.1 ribosome-binding protein 1 isoform X1 [Glossina fuscipes]XP_037891988.1 ribosome-binding protein 1 isoform X1 [Glossina fuscipes]XP_037891989.1 ribosome-binding protein 1 isoform X1 [Glossina fuscipes]XP_037891990.1 ribosome-binding protein 1 isoform X1 [Glossina fuscipes]XP_0
MMDLHILIVISCVFLASLFSLLFINKFFRRKTFEEIVAEKKALTEKIYGKERTAFRKPKKHNMKKELKREKKLRQRATNAEFEDSDGHSEQPSVEDDVPHGFSKSSPELEKAPAHHSQEDAVAITLKQSTNVDKEAVASKQTRGKKEKKVSGVNKNNSLAPNKNDNPNALTTTAKEEKIIAENLSANNSEVKGLKEFSEFKKSEKKEDKLQLIQANKKDRNGKKAETREKLNEKALVGVESIQTSIETALTAAVAKELKQLDEKGRQGSPKVSQQKSKPQHRKQKEVKDSNTLDIFADMDTVSVSLLMNLFRRAELNRSEIQILIDYLLNRQQDMPSGHSEWSDDVCQKLKRQLKEIEKALAEEQEASIGIQAKLRELRQEINTERVNMNVTVKSYIEKIQAKDQDITILEQKIKTLNDNLTLERQQFQAKLIHEKQAGSQDLLAQMQIMQNELSHKDKCIAELTCIVNASRQAVEESQQKNDIIQSQAQQLRALEQQRDDLEQVSNNRIFEIEKAKQTESEFNEAKLELCNMQNALESSKAENAQIRLDIETKTNELTLAHTSAISEKQQEIEALQGKNIELTQQLVNVTSQTKEQVKEQNNLQAAHQLLKQQCNDKQKQLSESTGRENEMKQRVISLEKELETLENALKEEIADKTQQLQQIEQQREQFLKREKELLQQLQEQKDKNNELRMKNWKLVEALQNAEIKAIKQIETHKHQPNANLVQQEKSLAATATCTPLEVNVKDDASAEKHLRQLLQRLYPEAVKSCAQTALSDTLEQWIEQVMTAHVSQQWQRQQAQVSSSHKSTQSSSSNHHPSSPSAVQNSQNGNGSRSNSPSRISTAMGGNSDHDALLKENKLLHTRVDELLQLATKNDNTLSDMLQRAEQQDEHWRSVVRSKDEQISALENPNGQQQDI